MFSLNCFSLSPPLPPSPGERTNARPLAHPRRITRLGWTDKNERVYFNLGMLAMDDKNIEEAENWFKRAVHLKQDFRSALFNLALLLADDDRPLEAAPFLNQLVKYHPDHIKGLILLGDIYINNIKDLDAAENVIESFFYSPAFSLLILLFDCCRPRKLLYSLFGDGRSSVCLSRCAKSIYIFAFPSCMSFPFPAAHVIAHSSTFTLFSPEEITL